MRQLPMRFPIAAITLLAALAFLSGCGGEREQNDERGTHRHADKKGDAARRAAKRGEAEVDALRTLPYVGFSDASSKDVPVGVAAWDRERTQPGYTLLTTRDLCRSELIDMSGKVVHSWTQPGVLWANTKLLPNGDLLVVGADQAEKRVRSAAGEKPGEEPGAGTPEGATEGAGKRKKLRTPEGHGYLLRLSWDNRVIWKKSLQVHHDVSVLPDGRILVLTSSLRQIPELSTEHGFRDDEVTLLTEGGEPSESHSLFEMLRDAPEPWRLRLREPWFWESWFAGKEPYRFQTVGTDNTKGGFSDLLHTNTVQPFPAAGVERTGSIYAQGNVLVTTRHQDLVSIVSLAEKKVVWVWGPGELMGPHDASWLPNGNILIFDNGLGRDWSRVIELDPETLEIAWEYVGDPVEDFYTATRGANQRLPDGNTLITESDKGHLFEILPDGTKVWDFWTPHRNKEGALATITRASRFPADEIDALLATTPVVPSSPASPSPASSAPPPEN